MQVGRLRPTLDRDANEAPLVDQFGQQCASVRETVVIGEIRRGAHTLMSGRPHQQFLLGLVRRQAGLREHVGRDHPLGEVVQPGEVVRATASRHLAGSEQVLESELAVVPVPPRALRTVAHREVTGHDRTLGTDPLQHVRDEPVVGCRPCPQRFPSGVAVHRPALQRIHVDRHVAGLVHPELEHVAVAGGVVDQRTRMRAESSEQWQLLAAHQHVHRVDLDETHPFDSTAQVPTVDAPSGTRVVEALRSEREPSRLRVGEIPGHRRDRTGPYQSSATVISTELITTSVFGLSPPPVGTLCIVSTMSRPFTT